MNYPGSKNKVADPQTAKLICIFIFAYADCWFPHEAAHLVGDRTKRIFDDTG